MSATTGLAPVIYPESDGKPMADNTIQFRWIFTLALNLFVLFRNRADVFLGGNIFWYPVEGFTDIVQAPDVYVVFGRPPGERSSYRQWEENNVPMTVVFEIRSPKDNDELMQSKREFYDEHGVTEYYMYDPQSNTLEAYRRRGGDLGPQRFIGGSYTSPLLGIRFQTAEPELLVFTPDGTPFRNAEEFRESELAALRLVDQERDQRHAAEEQARQAEQRAAQQTLALNRLRDLSRRARNTQATPEELAELDRLLKENPG